LINIIKQELDKQEKIIDRVEEKVDIAAEHLETLNTKMKIIVEKVYIKYIKSMNSYNKILFLHIITPLF